MKLLPFDLEKALSGKYHIVTRCGQEVDYIHDTGLDIIYPIVGHIKGKNCSYTYTKDGRINQGVEDNNDLFLVEETKKGWVVVFRADSYFDVDWFYAESEKGAREQECKEKGTYIDTFEVNY